MPFTANVQQACLCDVTKGWSLELSDRIPRLSNSSVVPYGQIPLMGSFLHAMAITIMSLKNGGWTHSRLSAGGCFSNYAPWAPNRAASFLLAIHWQEAHTQVCSRNLLNFESRLHQSNPRLRSSFAPGAATTSLAAGGYVDQQRDAEII